MQLKKIISVVALVGLVFALAQPVSAQGRFGFGYSHFGNHSGFSVGFSAPFYYDHYYPGYYRSYSYPVVDRGWVAGHWETREEQVWIRPSTRRVWIEPVYETARDPAGSETRVIAREGYWKSVEDPGHYEMRNVQVWIPGYYY